MPRCAYTDTCVFFNDEVGYSIDLQASMRMSYCLGDYPTCARYRAIRTIPRDQLPKDLIPSDNAWADELVVAYLAKHPAEPAPK